jgi:hypothetical protein
MVREIERERDEEDKIKKEGSFSFDGGWVG